MTTINCESKSEWRRQHLLQGRADTLLRLAGELSTLCDSPACIVIHNPNDAVKPWRIWPETEAEFRQAIQLYKNNPMKPKPKTKPFVSGSPPPSSSRTATAGGSIVDGSSAAQSMGLRSIDEQAEAADYNVDVDSCVYGIDSNPIDACGDDGKLCEWDECEMFEVDKLLNFSDKEEDDAVAVSAITDISSAVCDEVQMDKEVMSQPLVDDRAAKCGDGGMTCEWGESEIYELDDLLDLIDEEEIDDADDIPATNVTSNSYAAAVSDVEKDTAVPQPSSVSMSMPAQPNVLCGNKRKAPERVYSFSDLISPSAQRRKVIA